MRSSSTNRPLKNIPHGTYSLIAVESRIFKSSILATLSPSMRVLNQAVLCCPLSWMDHNQCGSLWLSATSGYPHSPNQIHFRYSCTGASRPITPAATALATLSRRATMATICLATAAPRSALLRLRTDAQARSVLIRAFVRTTRALVKFLRHSSSQMLQSALLSMELLVACSGCAFSGVVFESNSKNLPVAVLM
jgi:hypothetical protein